FAGMCYMADANNVVIEARDLNDTPQPGRIYVRSLTGGVWSQWAVREGVPFISDNAPPSNPIPGQLWWDDSHGQLFIWYDDGTSKQWVVTNPGGTGSTSSGGGGGGANITISDTPPPSSGLTAGSLWWESDTGILYIWYSDADSSQWVAVQAATAPTINAILFDQAQTLTSDQQNQAKANLAAYAKNYI